MADETQQAAEATAEEWPLKVTLKNKKILDKDANPTSEITLREPTGADIEKIGNPVKFRVHDDGALEFVYDEKKMAAMIAALGEIPIGFVRKMHPRDWNTCAMSLAGFFVPDLGTS